MQICTGKPIAATLISATIFMLSACNKQASTEVKAVASVVEAAKPKAPPATPEDWRKALESSYGTYSVRDEGDGVQSFMACFEPTPDRKNKCGFVAFGKRDAFRKLRFYETGIPMRIGSGISTYVSLKDNGSPKLLLAPYIFRDNWIFMNKVAIMVDGDVILERDLELTSSDRQVFPGGVQEDCDFVATEDQIHALRKIKPDSKVLIRITGKKGYMTLTKSDTSTVKSKIIEVLRVYDTILEAVRDKIPPTVTAAS
ncbi:hypothetical protein [Ralstonia pseudosolanacearum]|uniref:hypothetical protein n=1 Tax=Ralstonia pseudosolanacearum TaxID=1310165 RepID=UPI0026769A4D|nr:hypothetical protein [Ralstonia pseudosolanacearum]MDO3517747.1 hypothetical protein [Ralstonia pseudosolanacearum]MDO3541032.1 hypothetical protein [Ralstonia pseudosolanacearum]